MEEELAIVESYEATSVEAALMNMQAKGLDVVSPNEFLLGVMMDKEKDIEVRIKAATAAKKDNGKEQATTAVQVIVNNDKEPEGPKSFDLEDME